MRLPFGRSLVQIPVPTNLTRVFFLWFSSIIKANVGLDFHCHNPFDHFSTNSYIIKLKSVNLTYETLTTQPRVRSVHVFGPTFLCIKLRYSHYRPWRPKGDVDARVRIFAAMASPELDRRYPPVLILQEPEWTPGPVWTKSSANAPLRHPGSKPDRPARNLVPCGLNSLAHIFKL